MMNSQIEKLTQNNNLFADEAVQREDELNDIIKSQEEIIRESRIKIDELQIIIHNLTSKPKQTTSTQTEANNSSSKLIPAADKNKRIQVSNADQLIENVNKSAEGLVLIDDFVPIQERSESEPLSPPRNKKTPANQRNTKTEGSCDKKKSEVVNLIEKSHTGKSNDGLTLMEELENYEGSAAYSNNSDPHEESDLILLEESLSRNPISSKKIMIIESQKGFRYGHSCTTALFEVVDDIHIVIVMSYPS
ncbi:hypothetical protein JTB14_003495 [Gonioctena quinquepunctata]|nr:hypothetical protein JTB14_003495 [Gonioctena quinquepunctata]